MKLRIIFLGILLLINSNLILSQVFPLGVQIPNLYRSGYSNNIAPQQSISKKRSYSSTNSEKLYSDSLINARTSKSNLSNIDNFSYLQGRLIDQNYAGNFVDSSFMGAPSSLLINFFSQQGASGSPVFIELPSGDLQIVGMITGIIGSNNQYQFC